MNKIAKMIVSVVICEAAGGLGGLFTGTQALEWYSTLNRPAWTPPGAAIGVAWTVLYFFMGISLYLAWEKNFEVKIEQNARERKPWNRFSARLYYGNWRQANVILIFLVQLVLNIAWSGIFFGLRSPGWAFFELLALWVAIVYTIVNFSRVIKPAGYLLLPYLAWVTFAGVLNYTIWQLN